MPGKRPSTQAVLDQEQRALDDSISDAQPLWQPSETKARKNVEALLLERTHITEEQLQQAKNVQSQTPGKSIAQILLTMNAASEAQILSALAETLGLPFESPDKNQINPEAFNLL